MPDITPPTIYPCAGNHSITVIATAAHGPLIRAEVRDHQGKLRAFADTLNDAHSIVRLCDKLHKAKTELINEGTK